MAEVRFLERLDAAPKAEDPDPCPRSPQRVGEGPTP